MEWGYTRFTPLSVRPSVRLYTRFTELLKKNIGLIHFIPGIYPFGVSLLTPIHFRVPSLIFGSLVAKYLAEKGVSGTFWKKQMAQFISYMAFTLMGWVSWPLYIFVLLASFSALWWSNILPKMEFPELLKKTSGSIHFIPGILPLWGESLDSYTFSCSWPHFRPSSGQIFGWKWGFRNFLKKLLVPFFTYLAFTLRGWVSSPLFIFVFLASFSALWWQNISPKMGFLDEVDNDQSGGILSLFMDTACFNCHCHETRPRLGSCHIFCIHRDDIWHLRNLLANLP